MQLVARPGEVVTRDELRKELWPDSTLVDVEHGLNAAIRRLRDVLDDSADSPHYVETLPRRGYRFIGLVNGEDSAPAPPPRDSELFSTLAAERPDVARYRGFIGAIAARCGDRDRAQRIRAELTRPELDLLHEPTWTRVQAATFWRAHIAVLLGDRDTAVDLLSDALARGLPFGVYFHNDPDFESLRNYPPFLKLIRPRS